MASEKTIGRLQAQIQRRVAYCLQFEIADPRASFVTVTKVELSKDLARAKVYFSVLGTAADRSKTEHMLAGASGFVRRQLGRVLETRMIPVLTWEYDPSSEDAANISRLITEARKRDEAIRSASAAEELAPEAEDGEPTQEELDDAPGFDESPPR